MAIRDKCAEVLLQRVAILAGQALGVLQQALGLGLIGFVVGKITATF